MLFFVCIWAAGVTYLMRCDIRPLTLEDLGVTTRSWRSPVDTITSGEVLSGEIVTMGLHGLTVDTGVPLLSSGNDSMFGGK